MYLFARFLKRTKVAAPVDSLCLAERKAAYLILCWQRQPRNYLPFLSGKVDLPAATCGRVTVVAAVGL